MLRRPQNTCLPKYLYRKLLQDVLPQNKNVKQEKGRHGNREIRDLIGQRGEGSLKDDGPTPGPSTRQARLEKEFQEENLLRKDRGSSSNGFNQTKNIPKETGR